MEGEINMEREERRRDSPVFSHSTQKVKCGGRARKRGRGAEGGRGQCLPQVLILPPSPISKEEGKKKR